MCIHTYIDSITIHNSQKMEAVQMFTWWMINIVQHLCAMKYYSDAERNEIQILATMWMNLKNIMLRERSQTKGHTLYDPIYKFHLMVFIVHGRHVLQCLWEPRETQFLWTSGHNIFMNQFHEPINKYNLDLYVFLFKEILFREFLGRPVVRTPCFHCWGLRFYP